MYAVRKVKRHQKELRALKFAEALEFDNSRDFFAEVKKMTPKPSLTDCINGEEGDDAIAKHFNLKYQALYNSVASDQNEMENIIDSVNRSICNCNDCDFIIDTNDVMSAVQKLKSGKTDGDVGYNSSHLLYGSQLYFHHLSCLFTSMYIHGHQASPLLNATIVSIPKDYSKSLEVDSNYRGIALCCSISKLYDLIMLARNSDFLSTSHNQFAFKKEMGTTMCSLILKEVVQHYLNNDSHVYACFLDASKAFDRVRYDQLFKALINRGVQPPDLRLLLDQYLNQQCRASWKGQNSSYFKINNGIRQGSIASPLLFCVYLDSLLDELEQKGIGCWVGNHYYGALVYADDIVLVSPTAHGLKQMVRTCEVFCDRSDMQFNPNKSVCICFRRKKHMTYPDIKMGDTSLK